MDNELLRHIIDIKERLGELDAKMDSVNARIKSHTADDLRFQEGMEDSVKDLNASVNKGRGALLALSVATGVLTLFVLLQKLGVLA